jgi:hypothetical protein
MKEDVLRNEVGDTDDERRGRRRRTMFWSCKLR